MNKFPIKNLMLALPPFWVSCVLCNFPPLQVIFRETLGFSVAYLSLIMIACIFCLKLVVNTLTF